MLTSAQLTVKFVFGIQPVVQSRKTHLNYKSFSKIKIYEFPLSLARGKSLRTKKRKFQRLFQPVWGQERGHFDLINLDIVSSAKSGDCFFKSADWC